MTRFYRRSTLFVSLLIMAVTTLSACNFPGMGATPDRFATSAALTVAARLTPLAFDTPSGPPPQATEPPSQPPTAPPPTSVPPTDVPPTSSPTTTPSKTPTEIPCDKASFVTDVTIPDGEEITAGDSFTKTWRLRNDGSCSWTSSYSMIFDNGDSMSGPASVQLTAGTVGPGQSVDVSVNLTAPNSPGTYKGFWKLRNGSGVVFGVGSSGNVAFWVEIVVPEPAVPDFNLYYQNIHQCGILPNYATVRIRNTGDFAFESAEVGIYDETDNNYAYGPGWADKWFLSGQNDCPSQDERIDPGEVGYLALNIGAGRNNHHMRFEVKLCTENGLGGECVEKEVEFDVPP